MVACGKLALYFLTGLNQPVPFAGGWIGRVVKYPKSDLEAFIWHRLVRQVTESGYIRRSASVRSMVRKDNRAKCQSVPITFDRRPSSTYQKLLIWKQKHLARMERPNALTHFERGSRCFQKASLFLKSTISLLAMVLQRNGQSPASLNWTRIRIRHTIQMARFSPLLDLQSGSLIEAGACGLH